MFEFDAEENGRSMRGCLHARTHTHTHTHTRVLYSHNLGVECWSALFTWWPYYRELQLSDKLSRKLIAYCCEVQHRSADSSAVIKRAWRPLCCNSTPVFRSYLFDGLTCFCPTLREGFLGQGIVYEIRLLAFLLSFGWEDRYRLIFVG